MSIIQYPPEEVYNPPVLEKKNFEHIILWMLFNNKECEWSDFTQEPLELRLSTLSKYLSLLKSKGFVNKISKGHYKITSEGKKRFLELSRGRKKKRRVSYPPVIIKRRRNYDHWILWMVYNNNYCKWSDFLTEPLSINQSSLSKNMNLLIDKGFVEKENKQYRITRSGKIEYSRMLQDYHLDRQSILDEEGKRIEEITQKTIKFLGKYNIKDEDIQFRLLNNILKLDYTRVESMLTDEEDFDKILLFISINHPSQYPEYMSIKDFAKTYGINDSKLEYYIYEIVENNIYPIKFFKLAIPPNMYYYFQENEKLETMLRAITENHIIKFTYLNKLFSRSMKIRATVNEILEEICNILFDKGLKESLNIFLPEYINYLAYKIEAKVELKEPIDKLEGIIWQDIINVFQSQGSEELKDQYEENIREIEKEIEKDPKNLDLYNSKIKILLYYEQLNEVLILLDEMLEKFPESEKDIKMKKASVFRRIQEVGAGLKIIEELIEKFPEDTDLLCYKAYWLQYLGKKEDALGIIQDLVDQIPDNVMYHDTYGEILMTFEDYENSIKEFEKAIELASNEWFIPQSYIKLGICYKELKKNNLAVENLKKGIKLTNESSIDLEMKNKWLSIAEFYLNLVKAAL
ncbi:MAG: hypothetical protein ACFE9T_14125 [Promethearchaeota archaeon]